MAAWPSTFSRNPDRSISRPTRPRSWTSSISSLICSKVSTALPFCRLGGARPENAENALSIEVVFQQEARPAKLETSPPVTASGAEDEQ